MKNISFTCSIVYFPLIFTTLHLTSSLECAYCPSHSTEDECNEMNMTQICIKETKCGYARFIEKRKDLGQQYPLDYDREIYAVTVKKGCMEEDYCTKIEAKGKGLVNSSECIFCETDMCILKFPLMCVECDEAKDKYCSIQTEPIIKCPPGEVCYRLRVKTGKFTHKRGCMDSTRCLKKDYCEYCNTDICWTDPIPLPAEQRQKIDQRKMSYDRRQQIAESKSNILYGNYSFFVITVISLFHQYLFATRIFHSI